MDPDFRTRGYGGSVELTCRDIFNRRKARCTRCQSDLRFRGGVISQLQRAVRDREKAYEKLAHSFEHAVDNAEKLIK